MDIVFSDWLGCDSNRAAADLNIFPSLFILQSSFSIRDALGVSLSRKGSISLFSCWYYNRIVIFTWHFIQKAYQTTGLTNNVPTRIVVYVGKLIKIRIYSCFQNFIRLLVHILANAVSIPLAFIWGCVRRSVGPSVRRFSIRMCRNDGSW